LFFEGDSVSAKKSRQRTLTGLKPSLEQLRTPLHQKQVRPFGDQGQYPPRGSRQQGECRSAIAVKIRSACASNGETLPPRGFGAALPLSSQRCTNLIAELALMSKRSAASRRDSPSMVTASITRSRRSPE